LAALSLSGFLEGVIRGFKAGLLSQTQYQNLTQCDTLDDFKMQLCMSLSSQSRFPQSICASLHWLIKLIIYTRPTNFLFFPAF
jgi:hypothetical protein